MSHQSSKMHAKCGSALPSDVVLTYEQLRQQWMYELVKTLQEPDRKTWYPTIIGASGDQDCGQQARLYYSSMNQSFGDRKFVGRDIVFFRPGEPGAQLSPLSAGRRSRLTVIMNHSWQ